MQNTPSKPTTWQDVGMLAVAALFVLGLIVIVLVAT